MRRKGIGSIQADEQGADEPGPLAAGDQVDLRGGADTASSIAFLMTGIRASMWRLQASSGKTPPVKIVQLRLGADHIRQYLFVSQKAQAVSSQARSQSLIQS